MKAYYLTIIGVILLIISILIKNDTVHYNIHDTYLITERTFLLQIAAGVFLLAALVIKLINFIKPVK